MAGGAIRVRATMKGYYNHLMRAEGEVFIIKNDKAFSDIWMVRVDANAVTTEPDGESERTPSSMRDARKKSVVHPGKEEEVFEVEDENGSDGPCTDAPVEDKPKPKDKAQKKK